MERNGRQVYEYPTVWTLNNCTQPSQVAERCPQCGVAPRMGGHRAEDLRPPLLNRLPLPPLTTAQYATQGLSHTSVTWEPVFGAHIGDYSGGTLQVWSMSVGEFIEKRLRVDKGMQNAFG